MEPHKTLEEPGARAWPQPKLRTLQVEELYRYALPAALFSYFVALLTLGVLIESGDIARGSLWFLFATAVTAFRLTSGVAYRRRDRAGSPEVWARLAIGANLLAGVQWGLLGTVLFPETGGYRPIFVVMVITCLVGGSIPAYAPVKWAHEALSIPAAVPMAINLFFVQDGIHGFAGATALFFCFAIVYYARNLNRRIEERFRLQLERDALLEITDVLNAKLLRENRDLAHRAAVRGMSAQSARERVGRLEALFDGSVLPQIECDGAGHVVTVNRAAERVFGLAHHQVAGRAFAALLAGREAQARAAAESGEAVNVPVEVRAAGGARVPCTASFTPLPAPPGLKPGFAVILYGLEAPAETARG